MTYVILLTGCADKEKCDKNAQMTTLIVKTKHSKKRFVNFRLRLLYFSRATLSKRIQGLYALVLYLPQTTVYIPRTVSATVHFLNCPAMYRSLFALRFQKSLLRLPNAFVVHTVKTSRNQWCQDLRQYATQLHTNCTKEHKEISHSKTDLFLGSS